jgi:hypothetical protein
MGRAISGMNPGDMPSFQAPMEAAYEALAKSTASLKHLIVSATAIRARRPNRWCRTLSHIKSPSARS